MNHKGWKRLKKRSSTSFWVRAAPKSWLKYTTLISLKVSLSLKENKSLESQNRWIYLLLKIIMDFTASMPKSQFKEYSVKNQTFIFQKKFFNKSKNAMGERLNFKFSRPGGLPLREGEGLLVNLSTWILKGFFIKKNFCEISWTLTRLLKKKGALFGFRVVLFRVFKGLRDWLLCVVQKYILRLYKERRVDFWSNLRNFIYECYLKNGQVLLGISYLSSIWQQWANFIWVGIGELSEGLKKINIF